MKRIVLISVLAALLPVSLYAQPASSSVQSATPLPTTPVPITPLTEYFVDFDDSGSGDQDEGWDYVTVGSLMPYRVKEPLADADMPKQTGTDFRIDYKWHFSHSSASNPVLNMPTATVTSTHPGAATAAPTMSPATPNWYTTNEVSIRMPLTPTATGSEITLRHNTRFVFNGVVICDEPTEANDLVYRIKVVPRPSIKLTATSGTEIPDVEIIACVNDNVTFPANPPGANLVVDGFDKINVQFTLWHRPLGSTAAPTAVAEKQWLELSGKTLQFPGSLFTTVGVYTIDILNVTDRISRKSLDQDAVAAVAGADMPEDGKLKVFIYPQSNTTPETINDVQHIQNNLF